MLILWSIYLLSRLIFKCKKLLCPKSCNKDLAKLDVYMWEYFFFSKKRSYFPMWSSRDNTSISDTCCIHLYNSMPYILYINSKGITTPCILQTLENLKLKLYVPLLASPHLCIASRSHSFLPSSSFSSFSFFSFSLLLKPWFLLLRSDSTGETSLLTLFLLAINVVQMFLRQLFWGEPLRGRSFCSPLIRSGIEVMVGIPNEFLHSFASSSAAADAWVQSNLTAFMGKGGVNIK